MGARLGACHDTRLRLAGAGYLRYAARISLSRQRDVRPNVSPLARYGLCPVAICDGTDARSARLCTIANTRPDLHG